MQGVLCIVRLASPNVAQAKAISRRRTTRARNYPAKSRIYPRPPEVKVFCFFSSEKKNLLFLKKKKQKDFYFLVLSGDAYRALNEGRGS